MRKNIESAIRIQLRKAAVATAENLRMQIDRGQHQRLTSCEWQYAVRLVGLVRCIVGLTGTFVKSGFTVQRSWRSSGELVVASAEKVHFLPSTFCDAGRIQERGIPRRGGDIWRFRV